MSSSEGDEDGAPSGQGEAASPAGATGTSISRGDGKLAFIALAGVALAHVGVLFHFFPWPALSSPLPVLEDAYALQAYLADRAARGFAAHGETWIYDPQVLAGRPAGVVDALGSQLLPGGVLLLTRAGFGVARAFNVLIFACHLFVVPLGYLSARGFGSTRPAAVVTALLWSLLWYFDSLVHWSWFAGRIPWAVASMVLVLGLSSWFRVLEAGRRLDWALLFVVSLGVLVLHPLALWVLLGSAALGALWRKGRPPLAVWSKAGAAFLVPIGASVAWFVGAPVWASSEPPGPVLASTLSQLVLDAFDLLTDTWIAGGPVRTLFRMLCFAAAGVGIAEAGIRRSFGATLAGLIVPALVLGYLGGYLPIAWPLDPHALIIPASFAAAVAAGPVLCRVLSPRAIRGLSANAKALVALGAIAILPRVVRTVLVFVPVLLPDRVVRTTADTRVSPLVGLNEPLPDPHGHAIVSQELGKLAGWLLDNRGAGGRIVVVEPALAGFLATSTGLPVVGPLGERGAPHVAAFHRSVTEGTDVDAFVADYAIEWLVARGPIHPIERRGDLFENAIFVGEFRVRHARRLPSYFAEGSGRIIRASLGLLRVQGAEGTRVTLRYHYHPSLRCRPDCRVERAPVPGDPLGYSSIPSPPATFEIYSEGVKAE